jgi:hypothetical protein
MAGISGWVLSPVTNNGQTELVSSQLYIWLKTEFGLNQIPYCLFFFSQWITYHANKHYHTVSSVKSLSAKCPLTVGSARWFPSQLQQNTLTYVRVFSIGEIKTFDLLLK